MSVCIHSLVCLRQSEVSPYLGHRNAYLGSVKCCGSPYCAHTEPRSSSHIIVLHHIMPSLYFLFPRLLYNRQQVNEVIPLFGVPEGLLSDRGTNLLSYLMYDICEKLGITKLNTTAHHPQCDGMVERFNRTLKSMLRKHAARFGSQWDRYLSGALWAYRNVPHDSTHEKPSFLLLGMDCRTPTEAALLPPRELEPTEVSDCREELILSLSSARQLAAETIKSAQARYKRTYDKLSREVNYQLGDWVMIRFPQEETGKQRKLSRPWHGPYRIIERRDPDITAVKVYAPQDGQIHVHQNRVAPCPPEIPAGFFWYGTRRSGPGRPPKWVDQLLRGDMYSPPEPVTEEETPESHITAQDVPETSETEEPSHEPGSVLEELSELPFPEELNHDSREVEGSPSDTLPQQDGEDTVMRPKRSQDSETETSSDPTFGSSAMENQHTQS